MAGAEESYLLPHKGSTLVYRRSYRIGQDYIVSSSVAVLLVQNRSNIRSSAYLSHGCMLGNYNMPDNLPTLMVRA